MKGYDLAEYVIAHSAEKGDFISNKKLQKLMYYVEAWSLVYFGELVSEDFEAWVHGPVIPNVYGSFKHFGGHPIFLDQQKDLKKVIQNFEDQIGPDRNEMVHEVLLKYGTLSSFQLEALSHSELPWLEARQGLKDYEAGNKKINKGTMKAYYSSLLPSGD